MAPRPDTMLRRQRTALIAAHIWRSASWDWPASNGATTSSLPSRALFQGDGDVAALFLFSNGGSTGM